jgi:hypothetical protein
MLYDDENRGKIQLRNRARQIVDFSGLRYDNITPTDIDGHIEYHDEAMIFIELKHRNAIIPYGQKLALERNVNNNRAAGKKAVLFICEHYVDDWKCDIIAANSIVREFYYEGKWYVDGKHTLKQKCDSFIEFVNRKPF